MSKRSAIAALVIAATIGTAAFADPVADTNEDVRQIADPIIDNILEAMANEDHDAYVRDFDATMQKVSTEDAFSKAVKATNAIFGEYKSRTFLGFVVKRNMTVALWKARFGGTDDDVLIKLSLSRTGEKIEVAGLWFQ